jgi:hypothetical protein
MASLRTYAEETTTPMKKAPKVLFRSSVGIVGLVGGSENEAENTQGLSTVKP